MSRAIIALHAFTGCDYRSAFMRTETVRSYKLMLRRPEGIHAFSILREEHPFALEVLGPITSYVFAMYGLPKLASVNEARKKSNIKSNICT